jgi:deoxycytidylate deaminase
MQRIFTTHNDVNDAKSFSFGNKYLNIALRLISEHSYNENLKSHHAAVIVKGGKVLSIGVNKFKTHTMVIAPIFRQSESSCGIEYVQSMHAEMDAINKVSDKRTLRNAKIFVARLDKWGEPAMSCPCYLCQYYIKKYGIKRMIYTTQEGPKIRSVG